MNSWTQSKPSLESVVMRGPMFLRDVSFLGRKRRKCKESLGSRIGMKACKAGAARG